jgi:hypothetical protein
MMLFNEPFGRWTVLGIRFNLLFFILAVVMALFAFIMYIRAYAKIRQQNENEG